jgi:hypothetical protein
VVAVSLLNGPDPPSHFKQHILLSSFLILTINMLLASFTLHKVQKHFSGFGLRRKKDIRWFSLEACDPPELGWRDTYG